MNKKINNKRLAVLLSSYLLAILYFSAVNPENLSVLFILIPFIIIFGLLYITISLLLDLFLIIPKKQKHIITLVSSLMPTLLLIIQSITQLTIRDIILSLMIMIIIVWYSMKLKS